MKKERGIKIGSENLPCLSLYEKSICTLSISQFSNIQKQRNIIMEHFKNLPVMLSFKCSIGHCQDSVDITAIIGGKKEKALP